MPFEQTVLLLQGGGALGPYQAGVAVLPTRLNGLRLTRSPGRPFNQGDHNQKTRYLTTHDVCQHKLWRSALGMSGPKLIVQPDDGEKPVVNFLKSVRKTVALKQFTFTHPILLDTVMALHQKGVRVRVMLNGAKTTGERLNDPFFETIKSTGIEVQWSNPSFLVTHEKSIVVDGKSALLATFNFMEKYFQATRDYGVLTSDPAQVAQVQKCFDCDWKREPFHPHDDAGLAWSPENARHLVCKFIDGAHRTKTCFSVISSTLP